ncbi:glycosyltransferase family 4 protein [Pseudarthrobacter sulfonivorans]|uniref:glycosyltransferase family 4 protein n=1 Tax=Pseudarthrobacter sulfonivorans TaxID=121292 RepID=UPI0021032D9D|nr:glycosyltransferase family 4 protein [Pseudarthrobacter sulfonivorans]
MKKIQSLAMTLGPNDFVVTSQWPALLLLADAGVTSDLHIAHNVDTVISRSHDPALFRWMGNAGRMEAKERDILRKPKTVLAISGSDADRIESWGIPCKHLTIAPEEFNERTPLSTVIGFIGKATWPPNAQAIRLLVDEVLPKVREKLPSATVVLSGRNSETWSNAEGVTSLGRIDDLAEFYDAADLVVVPRMGESTGVSVKMLEAVTYGRPVVVPTTLARDAGLMSGAILADDVDGMVDVISDYLGKGSVNFGGAQTTSRESWGDAVKLSELEDYVALSSSQVDIEDHQ